MNVFLFGRRLPVLVFPILIFSLLTRGNGFSAGAGWSPGLPGEWNLVGRTKVKTETNSVSGTNSMIIQGGFAVSRQSFDDAEISFQARAPQDAGQVQIWGGFRCRDRDRRYVFALRGGKDNDLYLARYAPDGGSEFLGFAPLDFKPAPGIWYHLRIVTCGNRFQIYLGDEALPRINVADATATWNRGGVCLGGGWLPVEFAGLKIEPLTAAEKSAMLSIGDQTWSAPAVDKEALRQEQRAEYTPATVTAFNPLRTEIPLDGNWLFLPDYQLAAGQNPVPVNYDDQSWHIMPVPQFWTPGLSWLHGETSFKGLGGLATTKGVAESLVVQENTRVESYTFDWRKTKSAWYREYVELPADLGHRRFELTFDAIAKISEIWVNGVKVGAHTGMFGQINCDVTSAIQPGRNVIAVHVLGNLGRKQNETVEGVAVTVEVTSAMLNSLPHGMFQEDTSGIWQPVKLTATAPVLVNDCFVKPGLHGAELDLEILNTGKQSKSLQVNYAITSTRSGELLYSNPVAEPFEAPAGTTGHLRLTTPYLNPKLWSPTDPNLYNLQVSLADANGMVDRYTTRFGFRTFTVDGSRFLLNGRPYWLRGANPFPNTLRPNDSVLAHRFMQLARAGNVSVTRSHIVPYTTTWLDAADEEGMGVSFEGTWPWLMLQGNLPDPELLKVWKEEFLSLIREHRNHPSLLLWTVNNEMKFERGDQNHPALLQEKWHVLDDMIRNMRQTDPTRPIDADSSYVRKETRKSYETVVKPEGLDDGDLDDRHAYFGWYEASFFHFYDGEFAAQSGTPGRPLISEEMATGYPNNDDGHPVRFYLFKNYTPQALVGDEAYENADPAIFLKRQAFMTKELTETLRRTGQQTMAGLLLFSYLTWFQTPWSADEIHPWPAYYALQTALQPVLVSAELYGRHFYAGSTLQPRVCLINDAENGEAIPAGQLVWAVKDGERVLAQGQTEVAPVSYYESRWVDLEVTMPANLPTPRVDGQLVWQWKADGKIVSTNSYDIMVARREWTRENLNENFRDQNPLAAKSKPLVIDDLTVLARQPDGLANLHKYISDGGTVLLLHPGKALAEWLPDQVKEFTAKRGEIVTMHVPESPVFAGIEPLDLAWFSGGGRQVPIACTGVYQIVSGREDVTALASQFDLHGYLKDAAAIAKISGTPLVEIRLGKGRVIASELCLEAGQDDPIAQRVLMNLIGYLSHEP